MNHVMLKIGPKVSIPLYSVSYIRAMTSYSRVFAYYPDPNILTEYLMSYALCVVLNRYVTGFIRTHRSFAIQPMYIVDVEMKPQKQPTDSKSNGGIITLRGQIKIPVSKLKKHSVMKQLRIGEHNCELQELH